jgi:hypothetical protein
MIPPLKNRDVRRVADNFRDSRVEVAGPVHPVAQVVRVLADDQGAVLRVLVVVEEPCLAGISLSPAPGAAIENLKSLLRLNQQYVSLFSWMGFPFRHVAVGKLLAAQSAPFPRRNARSGAAGCSGQASGAPASSARSFLLLKDVLDVRKRQPADFRGKRLVLEGWTAPPLLLLAFWLPFGAAIVVFRLNLVRLLDDHLRRRLDNGEPQAVLGLDCLDVVQERLVLFLLGPIHGWDNWP